MVKVDLITGFLGAGKTTFLLKYAKHCIQKGERIGILEYDYGAVNVDMLLLEELRGEQCELEMVSAGCDSDCLNRRFRTKLIAMAMSGYDRVIIEPSGIFDMDLFFDTLSDEPLDRMYEIGNILTIISAKTGEDLSREEDFFLASHAANAGCIIFSRTAQVSTEQLQLVKAHLLRSEEMIRCRRFQGNYFEKDWNELTEDDLEMLRHCGYQNCSYVKLISDQTSQYSSICCLELEKDAVQIMTDARKLLSSSEYGEIVRVKGFAEKDGKTFELNVTRHEENLREKNASQRVLIVIGRNLQEKRIKELLNN